MDSTKLYCTLSGTVTRNNGDPEELRRTLVIFPPLIFCYTFSTFSPQTHLHFFRNILRLRCGRPSHFRLLWAPGIWMPRPPVQPQGREGNFIAVFQSFNMWNEDCSFYFIWCLLEWSRNPSAQTGKGTRSNYMISLKLRKGMFLNGFIWRKISKAVWEGGKWTLPSWKAVPENAAWAE